MSDDQAEATSKRNWGPMDHLDPAERRRIVAFAMLRIVAVAVFLIGIYFLLPFDRASLAASWLSVVVAVVGLIIVDVYQLRAVASAEWPTLRGMEALIISLTVMLVTFAALYLGMSGRDSGAFDEPLDHVGALYFTMTTLTTIGFGDIVPTSNGARIIVMVQMLANVIVIGVFVKLVTNTVQTRLNARK